MNLGQSPALPAARQTHSVSEAVGSWGIADERFRWSAWSAPRASPRLAPRAPRGARSSAVLPGGCPGPRTEVLTLLEGLRDPPPPPCTLVIAVWSDQKELDKPSRNFVLILQMKMETCLLKSRQLCQQAGLRQQGKESYSFPWISHFIVIMMVVATMATADSPPATHTIVPVQVSVCTSGVPTHVSLTADEPAEKSRVRQLGGAQSPWAEMEGLPPWTLSGPNA